MSNLMFTPNPIRQRNWRDLWQVAGRVLQLANALLDGGGAAEPGMARAGAQMLATSACLGSSEAWAGKVGVLKL